MSQLSQKSIEHIFTGWNKTKRERAGKCKSVPKPMGKGSMTVLECYDEEGNIKSSKIISSTDDYRIPETNVETKPKSNNQMAYIIGGIIVAGIVYFMFIKK